MSVFGRRSSVKKMTRFGVAMDNDDVVYPRTINIDCITTRLTPDDVDTVGDVDAALLCSSAALINLEVALASAAADPTRMNQHW